MAMTDLKGNPLTKLRGTQTGMSIKDVTRTRILLTGSPGSGKSTFVNSIPGAVILDLEEGGGTVPSSHHGALRYGPGIQADGSYYSPTVADYLKLVSTLVGGKRTGAEWAKPYTTLVIDTVDKWLTVAGDSLCASEKKEDIGDCCGGNGKGYFRLGRELMSMLDDAYEVGLGWIVVAHVKTVYTARSLEVTVPTKVLAVSASFQGRLMQACEYMLFCDRETILIPDAANPKKKTSQYAWVLKTEPGGAYVRHEDLKARLPLPGAVPLSGDNGWADFSMAYKAAQASRHDEVLARATSN